MLAEIVELYVTAPQTGMQNELHPGCPTHAPGMRAHLSELAVGDFFTLEPSRKLSHPRIIQIHRNRAARANVLEKRPFFSGNAGQAVQSFKMRSRNRGNDSRVRVGDFGKALNFSRMIGAEFDDGDLVSSAQSEEGQRQTDEIVEITFGL